MGVPSVRQRAHLALVLSPRGSVEVRQAAAAVRGGAGEPAAQAEWTVELQEGTVCHIRVVTGEACFVGEVGSPHGGDEGAAAGP